MSSTFKAVVVAVWIVAAAFIVGFCEPINTPLAARVKVAGCFAVILGLIAVFILFVRGMRDL